MSAEPDYKVPSKAQRKICLVVVDMQKCFFDDDANSRITYKEEIENIAKAIRMFHEHSRDVFVIRYVGDTHSISKDMNFLDELGELEPCTIVEKRHMSAFQNTQLPDLIVERGYDGVLIFGAYAEYCVMATYWGAQPFELSAHLLSGGVIGYTKEGQDAAETLCSTYTMDDVLENMRTATIDPEYNRTNNRMRRKYWYVN